jgi:hypothetical protein
MQPIAPSDLNHILDHTRDLWDEIWGEKIFIAGGTGFFGCWLLESFLWINQWLKHDSRATVLTRSPQAFIAKAPHLALDAYDPSGFLTDSGAVSKASSPSDCSELKISHSVKGKFNAHVEKESYQFSSLWIKLPYGACGEFILDRYSDAALFAGGIVSSTFISFLASLTLTLPHPVYLFLGHGIRPCCSIAIISKSLHPLFRECSSFSFWKMSKMETLQIIHGRISITTAWLYIQHPMATNNNLSGPPSMIEIIRGDLNQRIISSDLIKIDA